MDTSHNPGGAAHRSHRLPASWARWLMPLILTFLMTFAVAGISTWIATRSLDAHFLHSWMKSWMISWIIAFPAMVALLPVTQRLVRLLVQGAPAPTEHNQP